MLNIKSIFWGSVLSVAIVNPAAAIPMLQLDASGGVYNTTDESIHATGNPFTLYALGDSTSSKFSVSGNYYVSVAIIRTDGAPINLGDSGWGPFSVTGPAGS